MRFTATRAAILTIATCLTLLGAGLPGEARAAGRVVAFGDDWPTSDFYYGPSANAFTLDVFGWLTQLTAQKRVLVDDQIDTYLPYTQMLGALAANGYTVTRIPTSSWNLSLLSGYDAVLLEIGAVDATALADYVGCGGNAFVLGGGGNSDALYNPFLSQVGLSFAPYQDLSVSFTSFVAHPVTAGVTSLTAERPTPVLVTAPGPQVLCTQFGFDWLAVVTANLTCKPTPVRAQTWGTLKSHYR